MKRFTGAGLVIAVLLACTACGGKQDVSGLTPGTEAAYEKAAAAAEEAGLELRITSGYRDPEEQRAEFDEAVVRYGSVSEASRYVLPPEKSAHVKGTALDLGPRSAAAWLEETDGRYRLCRIYANEWWHFEYTPSKRCPKRLLRDATAAR
ncbi:M15 family metallopeptidase [Nonomuraea sp. NBC_01738]|uniref:M15 family metallopeptidase n=1 Tax=Nonomuraea sp. NBC_01738 TaxID=2976003 RepID=UPI002E0F546B|nr:M15 family metallopeptidase [Nonomuraea sp. NBC_01738]